MTTLVLDKQSPRNNTYYHNYSELWPIIKWDTLGNLEHLEISEMGLTFEAMFNLLSSINKKLRYLCIRSIHYELGPSVRYRDIQIELNRIQYEGSFQIDAAECY